jgi:uncharacterized iron-regulated membrane protein
MLAPFRIAIVAASWVLLSQVSVYRDDLAGELDHLVHRNFDAVAVRSGGTFTPAALAFHAERQTGGRVVAVSIGTHRDRAVRMTLAMPYGEMVTAYMDPFTADVRGVSRFGVLDNVAQHLSGLPGIVQGTAAAHPQWAWSAATAWNVCSANSTDAGEQETRPVILDVAIDAVERAGVVPPYTIVLPTSDDGAYVAYYHARAFTPPQRMEVAARDGRLLGNVALAQWPH